MNNLTRNTIILLLLFLIIAVLGIVFNTKLKKTYQILQSEISNTTKLLQKSTEKRLKIEKAKKELALLKEKQINQKKVLRKNDSSSISLNYFLHLRNKINQNLLFDFVENKTNQNDYFSSYNKYSLSGKTSLKDFVQFIFQIESQKAIYTIENLNVTPFNSNVSDSIHFVLNLNCYFDKSGVENSLIELSNGSFYLNYFKLFKEKIHMPISIKRKDLLDVDISTLVGIIKDIAFIRSNNGKIVRLKQGDRVKYGKLIDINVEQKEIKFLLNKFGKPEIYKLKLQGVE